MKEPQYTIDRASEKLSSILESASLEEPLSEEDIKFLLSLKKVSDILPVLDVANNLREKYFGKTIFAYGFVYYNTFCRNNCMFCYYRRSNDKAPRYIKDEEEVLDLSLRLKEAGVHLIDLTIGEDPVMHNTKDFSGLVSLCAHVKDEIKLPLMVSPGVIPDIIFEELSDVGVDWYACYQETHNRSLFKKIRLDQDYDQRLQAKLRAKEAGMLVEDGILLGVGEKLEDRAHSILTMKDLGVHQERAMCFIPQEGTPMERVKSPTMLEQMLSIAAIRLANPKSLIPASLDVFGIEGLQPMLLSGANVVTSLVYPKTGLKGVAHATLEVEEGNRTIEGIRPGIEQLGLKLGSAGEYASLVKRMRKRYG
ncbi:MAG: methylornithine synthase PylB [Methermicoccaceae archaeon]